MSFCLLRPGMQVFWNGRPYTIEYNRISGFTPLKVKLLGHEPLILSGELQARDFHTGEFVPVK